MVVVGHAEVEKTESARMRVPEALDVLYINQLKQKRFLVNRKPEVSLEKGDNRLVLQYVKFWGDDDDFDKVQSEPFMVRFQLPAGGLYQLQLPVLKSVAQAKAFAKKPTLILLDEAQQSIPIVITGQLQQKSFLASFVTDSAARADSGGGAQIDGDKRESTVQADDALEKLNFWWSKASTDQRKAFLKSVL